MSETQIQTTIIKKKKTEEGENRKNRKKKAVKKKHKRDGKGGEGGSRTRGRGREGGTIAIHKSSHKASITS